MIKEHNLNDLSIVFDEYLCSKGEITNTQLDVQPNINNQIQNSKINKTNFEEITCWGRKYNFKMSIYSNDHKISDNPHFYT